MSPWSETRVQGGISSGGGFLEEVKGGVQVSESTNGDTFVKRGRLEVPYLRSLRVLQNKLDLHTG